MGAALDRLLDHFGIPRPARRVATIPVGFTDAVPLVVVVPAAATSEARLLTGSKRKRAQAVDVVAAAAPASTTSASRFVAGASKSVHVRTSAPHAKRGRRGVR